MSTTVEVSNGKKMGSEVNREKDGRPEKTKRRHNPRTYNGNKREKDMYGEYEERLRQTYELPPEDAVVTMWEVVFLERNRRKNEWGEVEEVDTPADSHIAFNPMEGCTAENGEIKKFRVLSYTHGLQQPLHPHNKMVLECVYPHQSRSISKMTVPTCWIATGSTRAKVIKEHYDANDYGEI